MVQYHNSCVEYRNVMVMVNGRAKTSKVPWEMQGGEMDALQMNETKSPRRSQWIGELVCPGPRTLLGLGQHSVTGFLSCCCWLGWAVVNCDSLTQSMNDGSAAQCGTVCTVSLTVGVQCECLALPLIATCVSQLVQCAGYWRVLSVIA